MAAAAVFPGDQHDKLARRAGVALEDDGKPVLPSARRQQRHRLAGADIVAADRPIPELAEFAGLGRGCGEEGGDQHGGH